MAAPWPSRLLIISHVIHYSDSGRLFAYEPYAREIDVWAQLFDQVDIASPLRYAPPPSDCSPFHASNIRLRAQRETGGTSLRAKTHQVARLPWLLHDLHEALRDADAVHVRCPGNLGLLGSLLAPAYGVPLIAKYAGQWSGFSGEPLTSKLQRAVLRSAWWRGPVTVYAAENAASSRVVPFFTSVMTDAQMLQARKASAVERLKGPMRLVFVGRLSRAKNTDAVIEATLRLNTMGHPAQLKVIGDGPERSRLEALAGRSEAISFLGAIPFDRVLAEYATSDISVLISETEGWPKALVEAMAFGVLALGSNRGLVPRLLENRGIVVPPGDAASLTDALVEVDRDRDRARRLIREGAKWAQHHTLEELGRELKALMESHWGVEPRA